AGASASPVSSRSGRTRTRARALRPPGRRSLRPWHSRPASADGIAASDGEFKGPAVHEERVGLARAAGLILHHEVEKALVASRRVGRNLQLHLLLHVGAGLHVELLDGLVL